MDNSPEYEVQGWGDGLDSGVGVDIRNSECGSAFCDAGRFDLTSLLAVYEPHESLCLGWLFALEYYEADGFS